MPDFVWAVEAACSLLQKPVQRDLVVQQFAGQNDLNTVVSALSELGIAGNSKKLKFKKLASESFPVLVLLSATAQVTSATSPTANPTPTARSSCYKRRPTKLF